MTKNTRKDDETIDFSANQLRETSDFSAGDTLGDGGPLAERSLPIKLGRYEITKLLGRGGMGAVYLATDQQLQREVALKVPKFNTSDNEKATKRFYREARAAATLSHPNLCSIYDVAEIDGIHCIAMAYIKGRVLSDYIDAKKPPDPKAAATIIQKVALGMEEAHQNGILHRDLKPANIMIDRRKEPIVMDFGLACPSDAGDESRITQDGTLIGSPAYMSPEQLKGNPDEMGPASDQYSLGVVLYELLCGSLPFDNASSTITLLSNILTQPPRPLHAARKGLDDRLIAIVQRAMAKESADRYPSMKAFARDLARYVKDVPGTGPPAGLQTAVVSGNATRPATAPVAVQTVAKEVDNPFENLPPTPVGSATSFPTGPAAPRSAKRRVAQTGGKNQTKWLALGGVVALVLVAAGTWMIRDALTPAPPNDSSANTVAQEDQPASEDVATAAETPEEDPPEMRSRPRRDEGRSQAVQGKRQLANRLLLLFDDNEDERLTPDEIPEPEIARLMEGDNNGDGLLDRPELESLPLLDDFPFPGPGRRGGKRFDDRDLGPGGPGGGGAGAGGAGGGGLGFPGPRGPGRQRPGGGRRGPMNEGPQDRPGQNPTGNDF